MAQRGPTATRLTVLVGQLLDLNRRGLIHTLKDMGEVLDQIQEEHGIGAMAAHELTHWQTQVVEEALGEIAKTLSEVGSKLSATVRLTKDGIILVGVESVAGSPDNHPLEPYLPPVGKRG